MIGGAQVIASKPELNVSDGEMFRKALLSERCSVVAWHNDMQQLASMFGKAAVIASFTELFQHKVAFHMSEKDSDLLLNSGAAVKISELAIVYKCVNEECFLRCYDGLSEAYLSVLADKIQENITKRSYGA